MSRNWVIALLLLLLTTIVITGCGSEEDEDLSNQAIKLSMHLWPGYAHSYIAQEKGFFADEGVDVELHLIEKIPDNIANFVNGRADMAFGLQSDAMLLAALGFEVKIIYIADFSNGGDVIVSSQSIESVAGLKGMTVSVDSLNSFNHIFLVNLLEKNGLQESDITIVPIPASEVPDALDAGTIDAGQTWNPYFSTAIARGYRELATTKDAYGIVTDVLMVRTDTLNKRPDDVEKVLRALFKALKFRETDELAAYTIMSEAFLMPVGELRETIGGNIFPDLQENKRAFEDTGESTSLFASGRFISDFFLKKGIVHEPVDLELLHAPEIIQGIEP